MSSTRAGNIDVPPTPSTTQATTGGRRSASFEKHRGRNSAGNDVSASMGKASHSRSPSGSSSSAKEPAVGQNQSQSNNVGHGVPGPSVVALPPKERQLPSPPLTPVASISSTKDAPIEADATVGRVASTSEDGMDVDVVEGDGDGALSTWSFRPDASITHEDDDDDGASATGSGSAQRHADADVEATGSTTPLPDQCTPVPPAHDHQPQPPPSSSPMPPHPLDNGPSPQPWELVDPPPNNNADLEERLQRIRKESSRSLPGSSANIVIKDGKKYRIPHSSYYFGPPANANVFGTDPIGQIGVHHPREIIRIERDYSGGDLAQFSPVYPLELEGRITPTQFLETINAINEALLEAHSLRWSFLDNALAVFTLYLSRLFITSRYDRKMQQLRELLDRLNQDIYNPVGLNILWPKNAAFMFLEIEYY